MSAPDSTPSDYAGLSKQEVADRLKNPTPDATATPETDAFDKSQGIFYRYGAAIGFARYLEKKLTAAKAAVEYWQACWNKQTARLDETIARAERAEAQLRERTQWQCACGGTDCAGQAENERLRTEVERLNGVKNQLERTGFQTVTQLADAWLNHQNTFKSQTAYVAEVEARETQLRSRVGKLEAQLTSLADHAEEILGCYLLEKQIQGHPCPQNMVRCTQLQTAIDAARGGKGAT